jgi:PAS domain S-box-containing protein
VLLAYRRIALSCAALAASLGGLRLLDYLFAWRLELDSLGLQGLATRHGMHPAVMSPATAIGFALLGTATAFAYFARRGVACESLGLLALLTGWLGLGRYVYGGVPLLPYTQMAIHTAIVVLFLSTAVLALRPDVGIAALLASRRPGGVTARRLLPAALIAPLAAGALALYTHRSGVLEVEQAFSLFALASVLVLGGLVWVDAAKLDRMDAVRERSELAQRESRELLQAIIDNSPAVVYVKHLDGRYLLVNRRYEEIFALRREAILGKTDHDLFAKETADAFRAMDVRVAGTSRPLTEEEIAPHVDGPHAYISVKAPLADAAGKTYAIFGISTDITDRKRTEERLRRQLERMRLLDRITRAIGEREDLRSIFQVVIGTLEEELPIAFGCICFYEKVQQTLEVACVGVRSRPLALKLALPEYAQVDIDRNGLSRCVQGQLVYEPDIAGSTFPLPARLARGGLRSLVIAPLSVKDSVLGMLVAARHEAQSFESTDCEFLRQLGEHLALASQQVQLHTALQRAYEDLRQTQESVMQQERLRVLGQMAGGIAHDINNALSPAALYAQSLLERERTLSAEGRSYLTVIQRAIEDVSGTVARLREFYRPRDRELTLAPVDLNTLIEQVRELTHARWSDMPQERGIVIGFELALAPDLPAVMGAEGEIRDALTNLVLNAIDATSEGGTITVRSRADTDDRKATRGASPGSRVIVEVADSGSGMSETVRVRCLEPFFTTKGERGTGLGLAMVYGMVERHSGDIEIESEPDRGTTVRLIFQAASALAARTVLAAPLATRPLRILIVDDDPILLRSLQDTLQADGHSVVTADGGQAGIDEFIAARRQGKGFAVVISDLGMPRIDGRAVAAAVKFESPATPLILLTGWGQRLQSERQIPPHVDQVLAKPPRLAELRAALAAIADSRELSP